MTNNATTNPIGTAAGTRVSVAITAKARGHSRSCASMTPASPGALGAFYKSYKATNNAEPGTYSPEAYDVANIFIKGIDAGNTDRAKLLSFVNGLGTYEGVSKTIEFVANGNIKTPNSTAWIRNLNSAPL